MPKVTLFSKPECCLCDDAKRVIARARSRGVAFELELRNILDDAREFAEYRYAIPVVHVDGKEVARYRLSEEQLLAALNAADA